MEPKFKVGPIRVGEVWAEVTAIYAPIEGEGTLLYLILKKDGRKEMLPEETLIALKKSFWD